MEETEQNMSTWTDLLHSSTKLLEQAPPSAQFPPLQRTLDELETLSKKLEAKTQRTEVPQESIAAARLPAREGLNAEQLAHDLKSFELKFDLGNQFKMDGYHKGTYFASGDHGSYLDEDCSSSDRPATPENMLMPYLNCLPPVTLGVGNITLSKDWGVWEDHAVFDYLLDYLRGRLRKNTLDIVNVFHISPEELLNKACQNAIPPPEDRDDSRRCYFLSHLVYSDPSAIPFPLSHRSPPYYYPPCSLNTRIWVSISEDQIDYRGTYGFVRRWYLADHRPNGERITTQFVMKQYYLSQQCYPPTDIESKNQNFAGMHFKEGPWSIFNLYCVFPKNRKLVHKWF